MTLNPSDTTPETIPGDPSHQDFAHAENEFNLLAGRGAGQPYLMAIKLRNEPRTFHLRAYLGRPSKAYKWANLALVPQEVQNLAAKTSRRSALAWSPVQSGGTAPSSKIANALSQLVVLKHQAAVIDALDVDTGHALASYLRHPGHGLFFDPTQNHNAWIQPAPLSTKMAESIEDLLQALEARFPAVPQGDAAAETFEADPDEVEAFCEQIKQKSYDVPDATAMVKTRGSAQRAFSAVVKANYAGRCAITGVTNKDFLVASHIVPWSQDQSIRLDPSNGICLSLFVDRAFEQGYLQIEDDFTIRIDWIRVGEDHALREELEPYDGKILCAPIKQPPQAAYLQRRRALFTC